MYQAQVVSDNILRKKDMGILRRGFVFEQNEYIPFVQFFFFVTEMSCLSRFS